MTVTVGFVVALVCAAGVGGAAFATTIFLLNRWLRPWLEQRTQALIQASQPKSEANDPDALSPDRARQLLEELHDVAAGLTAHVEEHSVVMDSVNTELEVIAAKDKSGDVAIVLKSIARVVSANRQLKQELSEAQSKIEEQSQEIKSHMSIAMTDPLTGVANRRAFDSEMKRRLSECRRRGSTMSLVMVDVDHFKRFNDTFGHQAGDVVLQGVAGVLQSALREMDIVARYGGEEFAIVLPATELDGSALAADRMRQAVRATEFAVEGIDRPVTVSVGVATLLPGESAEALLRRADESLYASKNAGRDRVHYHDGSNHRPFESAAAIVAAMKKATNEIQPTVPNSTEPATDTPDRRRPGATPVTPAATIKNGLIPREQFDRQLQAGLSEHKRYQTPMAIMVLDIDNIEQLAAKGERAVELVTDTLGKFLRAALRDTDYIAPADNGRYFVHLPVTTLDEAQSPAQRIRRGVEACNILSFQGEPLLFTVSCGVAAPSGTMEFQELVGHAEAALLAAHQAGHNRVYTWDMNGIQAVNNGTDSSAKDAGTTA